MKTYMECKYHQLLVECYFCDETHGDHGRGKRRKFWFTDTIISSTVDFTEDFGLLSLIAGGLQCGKLYVPRMTSCQSGLSP